MRVGIREEAASAKARERRTPMDANPSPGESNGGSGVTCNAILIRQGSRGRGEN